MKKLNISTTGQLVVMAVIIVAILVLTAWGLKTNSNTRNEIIQAQQQYLDQLKAAQDQLNSQSPQQKLDSTNPSGSTPKTSVPAGTNKSAGSKTSVLPSSPVSISAEDKDTATFNLHAILGFLEAYQADNGYYPSEANYSTLASTGINASLFTFPTGIHMTYTPSPNGCSTAAKNCQHYSLGLLDSNNNPLITPLQDMNR